MMHNSDMNHSLSKIISKRLSEELLLIDNIDSYIIYYRKSEISINKF